MDCEQSITMSLEIRLSSDTPKKRELCCSSFPSWQQKNHAIMRAHAPRQDIPHFFHHTHSYCSPEFPSFVFLYALCFFSPETVHVAAVALDSDWLLGWYVTAKSVPTCHCRFVYCRRVWGGSKRTRWNCFTSELRPAAGKAGAEQTMSQDGWVWLMSDEGCGWWVGESVLLVLDVDCRGVCKGLWLSVNFWHDWLVHFWLLNPACNKMFQNLGLSTKKYNTTT